MGYKKVFISRMVEASGKNGSNWKERPKPLIDKFGKQYFFLVEESAINNEDVVRDKLVMFLAMNDFLGGGFYLTDPAFNGRGFGCVLRTSILDEEIIERKIHQSSF